MGMQGDCERWRTVLVGRMRIKEGITLKEGRVASAGVRATTGDFDGPGRGRLALVDKSATTVRLDKKRARSLDLLQLCGRLGAIELATHHLFHWELVTTRAQSCRSTIMCSCSLSPRTLAISWSTVMLENCPPESCIGARCRKVHTRVPVKRRTPAKRAIARFCTTIPSARPLVGERSLIEEVAVSRGSQAEYHFHLEVFRLWLERRHRPVFARSPRVAGIPARLRGFAASGRVTRLCMPQRCGRAPLAPALGRGHSAHSLRTDFASAAGFTADAFRLRLGHLFPVTSWQ